MYFGASGIDSVAQAICGNERINMGVRPVGFHAGNMASTVVYTDLLCKKTFSLGKKVNFHISFCLSDAEQYKAVRHPSSPKNTHYFRDCYPDGKTIQFTMCPQKPNISVVDAWLPVYENALIQISQKWPGLSWNIYRTTDLKKYNAFKTILLTTIEKPDEIATVIEESTGQKVYRPVDFVRAICPFCKTPVPNTRITPSGLIAIEDHKCHNAHGAGEYSYDALEYWTHYIIAILAEWASLDKFDIVIFGYDHSGCEKAWLSLAKYYGIENKIYDTIRLYAPLILSFDGKKMGKSNYNIRYTSISLLTQFLETSNALTVQLPDKNLSSDISSSGIPVPQYLQMNTQEKIKALRIQHLLTKINNWSLD
jgi:hypothetical protein